MSYTAIRALWDDYLEHSVDDHSGVLSELTGRLGTGNEPKRIFCGQKITKGSEVAGYSYIVNNSRMWAGADHDLVEKGDYLLTWRTPE